MAYAIDTTITETRINGRRHVYISLTETDVQTNSEGAITDSKIPRQGTIVRFQVDSDIAAAPKLGRASGWTAGDVDQILSVGSAATSIANDTNVHYQIASGISLYLRSTPDSNGAAINTDILIVEGWI